MSNEIQDQIDAEVASAALEPDTDDEVYPVDFDSDGEPEDDDVDPFADDVADADLDVDPDADLDEDERTVEDLQAEAAWLEGRIEETRAKAKRFRQEHGAQSWQFLVERQRVRNQRASLAAVTAALAQVDD